MGKTGIIYIMTTSVKGLIKIGKTDNFKNRMANLEQNGYWNVSGLHPYYAVRVKNYNEKEKLIHTVFSKSQVSNSELFALDKDVAKEMLESFEGEQVYPDPKTKAATGTTHTTTPSAPTSERFTFKKAGIPVGSVLTYIRDDSITCKTADDKNKVIYQGKQYTISGLAKDLEGSKSARGSLYWQYKNELLEDIRTRLGF